MCVATVLSLFVVPVLYIVIKTAAARFQSRRKPALAGEGPDISNDGDGLGHPRKEMTASHRSSDGN
jgi:HAE1 family hydrophobic/amphiphilic exporter-1